MTSWRERTSAAAQAQLDRILDTATVQAQAHLARAQEFDPFALFLDFRDKIMLFSYDRETGKAADVDAIVANLVTQLQAVAEPAQATALVINSHLSREKTDALEMRLEHKEGVALLVFLPYKRANFGPNIEFGEFMAFAGTPEVWR